MQLAQLTAGIALVGLEPDLVSTVVAIVPIAEGTVQVIYRLPDGTIKERLLSAADEASIAPATSERPWAFDGDGAAFQLTCEAKRIDLAFLFDPMMAVHTSNVEPLPHQITAVYESMLPRQPLRFVLADDPGAGKTIMAGLYIRELVMRADARRVLIVAPGSLVEQWRDELFEKFGLEFRIFSSALEESSPSGNPFEDHQQIIVRLDQMSRNEELQDKLCAAGWDLVVFDEAHKLAAHFFGSKLEKTGRFRFAEKLGKDTRHLLLMTATPHNGKEEDFQLFLSLIDSDRFYGKFRDGVHKVDTSDLMRRMVKEELVKFDGTPLFPERKAYTVNYKLSDAEAVLYEAVTKYVQTEMGKADLLAGSRKGSVGFALTTLQRRLASSPEAIYQSLKRRKERLSERLRAEKLGERGQHLLAETVDDVPEDDDDLNADEQETLEEKLVDQATAAKSIVELEDEIRILGGLEQQAKAVVASGQDRKWEELSKLLQNNPTMHDESGRRRKIIIFSEHRDTLNYLHAKIAGVLGTTDAIVTIHGGVNRDERRKSQALFRSDPDVRVLIATDAAGEGVNLQCAHLMVNYDLPWNPNRLEQRFGRIHRIGQTEVCHLWSLVAKETREGTVWHRLLEKIAVECDALKGKVFNILGDVFEEKSLKDLIIEAIRYGDQPEVRARLTQRIDHAFDHDHLRALLNRNALAQESMTPDRLFKVKEDMERAEARRLQPFFVRSFFLKAFDTLGGTIHRREAERCEITHVPAVVRERDRRITGRNRREFEPILKRYERVAFTRDALQPLDKPGVVRAVLMHPGHPLMLALTDILLEQNANLLRRGAVLVDPADATDQPWLLFLLTHEVKSGDGSTLSKRMQFIRVNPDGSTAFAGWAPHLDLEPLAEADRPRLKDLLAAPWIRTDQEQKAVSRAAATLVPDHYKEVATRRIEHVELTIAAVHERLTKEIGFWTDREIKLKDDAAAGKDVRLNLDNVKRTLEDLQSRLDSRKKHLQAMRQIQNGTPVILGGALVVPAGLVRQLRGEGPALSAADAAARKRIEMLAMNAVIAAEEAKGHRCADVSADNCGWDVTSYPPTLKGLQPNPKHIEVKGRVKGADTITVTRNEILYAFNQDDKFVLAIVFINPDDSIEGPYYVTKPFQREPDWGAASVNYTISELLKTGRRPSVNVISPKKLIEVALPLDAINIAAAREKSIRHGHPSTLHLWWARRPLAAARAVIFAQLVNDPEDLWRCQNPGQGPNQQVRGHWTKARDKLFTIIKDLVLWENTTNEAVLKPAREAIRQSWRESCELNKDHPQAKELFNPDKMPGLHDPFAGGGSIPVEAQRLGLEAYASDLNPVAVLINKAMIEIPPKFAGKPPVHPDAQNALALWNGAAGLAEDVRRYGQWMRDEAFKRIGHLYPPIKITKAMAKERPDLEQYVGEELTAIAWLWARTVKSPNPAFSEVDVPLVGTFSLSNKEEKEAYVQPVLDSKGYRFTVKMGMPSPSAKEGTKASRGNFRCLMSQAPIDGNYLRTEAKAGRMGHRLMAIIAQGANGRIFLSPIPDHEAIAESAKPKWKPDVEFFQQALGFRVGNYGMTMWSDLFTNRQLEALNTFSGLICEARDLIRSHAVAFGLPNDDRGLDAGGIGALGYAEAITTYLSFALDKSCEGNTTLCTWSPLPTKLHVVSTFSRQVLSMVWDFAEANLFADSSGNFFRMCELVSNVISRQSPHGVFPGHADQINAVEISFPESRFISTDPPYYDNIGYADLSDFFYVWLRRALQQVFPNLLATITVPKAEELVATPARHGGQEKAEQYFLEGMTRTLQSLGKQAHPSAPVTIFYAFKQADTENAAGTSSTGWETFLNAAIRAGFAISGTWPMKTEREGGMRNAERNSLASSIILVCRPRTKDVGTISRRQFVRMLNEALPLALDAMTRESEGLHSPVAPVDLSQAIIGPGMAIFSRYDAVLEADGKPMTVRTALQLINRFLAEDDFDADTQFCLHWFEQHGWETGKFGEADTLARAKGTSVAGVQQSGVIESGAGNVRIMKWKEYAADWDPATDARLPIWEALHQLIRAYNTEGDSGAALVLKGVEAKAEAARQLAYRLYTLCERRGWAEDARAYNEVVTGWSGIESAAAKVVLPKQGTLFEKEE